MLRLLLHLAAVSQLAGALSLSSQVDISSCPVSFFGQIYTKLYVDVLGETLTLCFKGPPSSGNTNDCLKTAAGGVTSVHSQVVASPAGPGSDFHRSLGRLSGSSPCAVTVNVTDGDGLRMTFDLRPFDDQAAVLVQLHDASTQSPQQVSVQVDGVERRRWNLTDGLKRYEDVSGCRHSGLVYEADTVACDSSSSSVVTCDASAALSVSPCGPESRCHGNGRCVSNSSCTVTGPAVVDFSGHVGFVRDRCARALMSLPGFQLLAAFQERRRKDVSFLDQLILRLEGAAVDIYLTQDGRVQLDNTTLSLDDAPQSAHGVKLSKDKTGVTAEVERSTFTASISFDGTTAQIHLTGPAGLHGLCVNSSSSLGDVKLTEFSSDSCETQHSEPADSRINCTLMTERCNLLREAPFTSCHSHMDPAPHITACADTLCRYPAVDGLRCHFLEAYVRACSRLSNDTVEGWRSKASCSPPQGSCQDTLCGAHEFCGDDIGGRSRCLCRAVFASEYRSKGVLGEPTVCRESSASVSLAACLLRENGIDPSELHLNDRSCGGQMDEETGMVTFGFDSRNPCGAVVLAGNDKITYKNTIKSDNSTASSLISRHSDVNIDFSCFYNQPEVAAVTFTVKGGDALQEVVSGSWNYSLKMGMFSDAACTQPIDFSKGVGASQTLYISLDTQGLDPNVIRLKTESCWATNGANGDLRYDLVTNGCGNPQDSSVKVAENGKGGTLLSFKMFQFRGSNSGIFLQCKMKLCVRSDPSCQQSCRGGGRRRRSIRSEYEDENPVFISLSWT